MAAVALKCSALWRFDKLRRWECGLTLLPSRLKPLTRRYRAVRWKLLRHIYSRSWRLVNVSLSKLAQTFWSCCLLWSFSFSVVWVFCAKWTWANRLASAVTNTECKDCTVWVTSRYLMFDIHHDSDDVNQTGWATPSCDLCSTCWRSGGEAKNHFTHVVNANRKDRNTEDWCSS